MPRYYPEKPKKVGAVVSPDFPADKLPPECVELWESVWDYGAGVYTLSSSQAVIDFCRLQWIADASFNLLLSAGMISTGSTGQVAISPEFKVFKEVQGLLTTSRDRLGLSPRAAAELGLTTIQAQSEASKLDAWINE